LRKENDQIKAEMEAQKTRYKEELKKAEELLVQADKEGFKEFYEKMNEKLAQSLYEEILKEEKANEKAKEFAQIYEKWTPRLLQKYLKNWAIRNWTWLLRR